MIKVIITSKGEWNRGSADNTDCPFVRTPKIELEAYHDCRKSMRELLRVFGFSDREIAKIIENGARISVNYDIPRYKDDDAYENPEYTEYREEEEL